MLERGEAPKSQEEAEAILKGMGLDEERMDLCAHHYQQENTSDLDRTNLGKTKDGKTDYIAAWKYIQENPKFGE
ncbi:MAG TPA: hypothetical protein PLV72_03505 [Candidatus Magasanikbacteria bacterium]|nr:hypothetical protein [Candidatus Magasanikbacteria bacterium]